MIVYLKLSGSKGQQIVALKAAHSDLIAKNEDGEDELRSIYTDSIALHYDDQTPAGAFIMVVFRGDQELPGSLPAGLTRKWQSGGAPVEFYGG